MLLIPASTRVYLASKPVDMRRGFNGLCALVADTWKKDPFVGHLFVFVGKRKDSDGYSFKVRGTQLLVDFLVPLGGRPSSKPVLLPALGVAAHPLRYLDYLIEEPGQAAVVGGDGVLVNVPSPARFALHKLIIAGERTAAFAAKTSKDVMQAELLIDVLLDDRPGDLPLAWDALRERGRAWRKKSTRGATKLAPATRRRLGDLLVDLLPSNDKAT